MKSLSGLDSAFLYTETPNSPMHIASVAVIDGALEFEDFREFIRARLHLLPVLRQRLMTVPLSVDYPYWVDDPNFDLHLHLDHVALPKPGSWRQLRALTSQIISKPLDFARPLWLMTFVEGLDGIPQIPKGSVALIVKVHHVAIDGVAGADILSLLFDPTPEPRPVPPAEPFAPKSLPSDVELMVRSSLSFAMRPLKLPRMLAETASATVKAGVLTRVQNADLPTVPFTAPRTIFNGRISGQRKWNTAFLSLDRIKALKNKMGVTVNDVMLAICSGALRRYLDEKGKLPSRSLVAYVPVSTRGLSADGASGNQLSAMLVQLATQIEEPVERLETIHQNSMRGKMYQQAMGANALSNLAEAVPFGLANQAARLYTRYQANVLNPVCNVVITNVPGPRGPIYMDGHQVQGIMGGAPIIDGMALIITILSYNGMVTISPTSDAKTMPDIDVFTRYLWESANELEAAVLTLEREEAEEAAEEELETAPSAELIALLENFAVFLQENPDVVTAEDVIMQLEITGSGTTDWQLDLSETPAVLTPGRHPRPDVTLTMRDEHLMRMVAGDLDIPTALMQGRLRATGETEKVMQLGFVLAKYVEQAG